MKSKSNGSKSGRPLGVLAAFLALVLLPALAWAQSCSQLRAEATAAAKVYQTCMSTSYKGEGPCTQQKLNWLSLVAASEGACNPLVWVVAPMQPDVKQGGRVNGIAVDPSNDHHILVASETGGLFVSNDKGKTWSHVDTLPVYQTFAVTFLPGHPSIVIATAGADFQAVNGGGIWRSTDGGVNWTQVPSPPQPTIANGPMSATEISIAPDTGQIYVASNFGLSIGTQLGTVWTQTTPFANGDPTVLAVVAQSNGRILAGGSAGIMRSVTGGSTWLTPTVNTAGITDFRALGRSPFSSDQAYAVDGNTVFYYTEDAGDHWKTVSAAPANGGGGCGGVAFVKTVGHPAAKGVVGAKDKLDLFYSDECWVYQLEATRAAGKTSFDYSGTWTQFNADHSDSRDLAFDSQNHPFLMGSDGGLLHPINSGADWTYIGGGHDGYDALQITEIKGQIIDGLSRHDLYFGTQDNDLWSSKDMGATWKDGTCCEGFLIESLYHVPTVANDQITYVSCSGCGNHLMGPLFTGIKNWPDPQTPPNGNPMILSQSFDIEAVQKDGAFAKGYAATDNLGGQWSQYATLSDDIDELPRLSWLPGRATPIFVPARPVLYQAVKTGWYGAGDFQITGLARIVGNISLVHGLAQSPTSVSYPAMTGFGGLGINPTMFAWYQVFAVDPNDPNHLIAPDVINQKMMQTTDGANTWTEIPGLTSLVTNNGAFLFNMPGNQQGIFSFVSALKFDPDNASMIALGTWENGVFISPDGGATWSQIPNTQQIPRITSFEWLSTNDLIVSSYGRGLWRLTFERTGFSNQLTVKPAPGAAATAIALAPDGGKISPLVGRPVANLIMHGTAGNHVASAGQMMDLTLQFHRPAAMVTVKLDGKIVQSATIDAGGRLTAKVAAPRKAGLHAVTITDTATGKVTDGAMFIVRAQDPADREGKGRD